MKLKYQLWNNENLAGIEENLYLIKVPLLIKILYQRSF